MRIGTLVKYRFYPDVAHSSMGVVTQINRVDPDRPFFFVSWIHSDGIDRSLNNTWYHPTRLEVICE